MLARQAHPPETASRVPPIERIEQVLANAGTAGTFATRRTAGHAGLQLEVAGVGAIPLPLSPAIARRLCAVARPARYGLRERTLLDRRVRDTWEIGKGQIHIEARAWRRTLDAALGHVARGLGLPGGATLRAKLHNLLVYGPGQFFAPHQDSEKADGMIGSLVVMLPSESKGGALVVEHHDERVSYRGSPDHLVLVAFYADCRHEVRPVTAGYRAALTYNLFVDDAMAAPTRPAAKPVDALVELVREHFTTPRPSRGPRSASTGAPDRLVYLLDHEYTQNGLSWRRLKNGDAVRAAALREVAARLDCEIVLALADVHETWSCEDDWEAGGYGTGWRRRRRSWYADSEDADRGDGEELALIELCSSDIELRHWLAPADKRVQAVCDEVLDDEICFTKRSVDLEPFRSEHEGYTGNAGNTVDRWYHRAAVMLWRRGRTFAIRAKAAPAWGVRTIAKALARGAADEARREIGEMLPFWDEVAARENAPGFLDRLLQVAAAIDDARLAAALVAPVALERLTPRMAARWRDLLARYGLTWCAQVFERWTARDDRPWDHAPRATWLGSLPALCAGLCTRGGDESVELVRRIVRAQWAWLDARIGRWSGQVPASQANKIIARLSRPIVALLAASALAGDRELQATIVARLTAERGYPIAGAVAVLRAGARHGGAMQGLGPLHDDCTRALSSLASTPPRGPADWSIAAPLRCRCELCARLGRFLRAADEQLLEWPLAKDRRAHVHQTITGHELPVTHVTRRVGSPYTLILTKTRALFARDAAERAAWARDLAWLSEAASGFAARGRRGRADRRAAGRRV